MLNLDGKIYTTQTPPQDDHEALDNPLQALWEAQAAMRDLVDTCAVQGVMNTRMGDYSRAASLSESLAQLDETIRELEAVRDSLVEDAAVNSSPAMRRRAGFDARRYDGVAA